MSIKNPEQNSFSELSEAQQEKLAAFAPIILPLIETLKRTGNSDASEAIDEELEQFKILMEHENIPEISNEQINEFLKNLQNSDSMDLAA